MHLQDKKINYYWNINKEPKLIFHLKHNYLRTSDFNTMYTTDCVNQIVCFIYNDYIAVKPYSTGFSGGLVEKDVIW